MSGWLRPRNIAIVGGLGALAFLFPRSMAAASPTGNIFETQGTKNIGNRYAAGGGSNTHQTGVATQRGNMDETMSTQQDPKGIDSGAFQEGHGDQKVADTWPKSFNKAQYGPNNEKGK